MNALLNAIVPYIVPAIFILVGYAIHHFGRYIPAQQRAYISMFADMAVRMVREQMAGMTDAEQKAASLNDIKVLFKAFNLPAPADDILIGIINAAFNALNNPPTATLQGGKPAV